MPPTLSINLGSIGISKKKSVSKHNLGYSGIGIFPTTSGAPTSHRVMVKKRLGSAWRLMNKKTYFIQSIWFALVQDYAGIPL